jgi:hypothetical protein
VIRTIAISLFAGEVQVRTVNQVSERLKSAACRAVCLILLGMGSAQAATEAKVQTRPSFAGIWNRNTPITQGFGSVDVSAYKPEYASRYQTTVNAVSAGKLDLGAQCLPTGAVRAGELGLFEILYAPTGRLTLLYEFMTQVRRIYLDGQFPDPVDPTVNGYSVAHWQGNTLVVETRGISEFSYLDRNAAPHSEQLRMTEKISLLNPDLMQVEVTLEDAEAFVKPMRYTKQFERLKDGELIDYECNENPRNPLNADGSVGFELQQTR